MDGTAGPSTNHLNVPYAERWGLLKDVMARLYMDEKKKLKEIVEIMKAEYRFYASEPQYKRQFGLWNMKRALPAKKKAKIREALETRAQQGKSSVVLDHGKVEVQKVRRYLKEQARRDISIWTNISSGAVGIENLTGHALQCGNRVFMNWSMPGSVLRFLKSKVTDQVSPFDSAPTPMSDILVATPSSNAEPSPRNPPSASNGLSPNNGQAIMTAAVQENLKVNRAHLFVQKHHSDLLRGMNLQEQWYI
ncbi:hypothetical protein EG329_014464 [Mollisiaceae sp. DMI_Dod_QoI]|nr:hypothetical protein EG329_014464 [Helotiales sp. DMI_Dod_QoI]